MFLGNRDEAKNLPRVVRYELVIARALLFSLLFATSAVAASFDCAKATAIVEKTICGSSRLSALDDELAKTYAVARKSGGEKVRDAQRQWLRDERNACEDEECIEAAYLLRIATLRLANRALFAQQKVPSGIAGRYAEMQEVCFPSEEDASENDCEGEVENFIDITRQRGNALAVDSEIYFYAGHLCMIEKAPAEWVGGELRVALLEESGAPACVLLMRFREGGVVMSDPLGRCKDASCGARGSFDAIGLPKE